MNQSQQKCQCNILECSCWWASKELTDEGLPVNPFKCGGIVRTPDIYSNGPTRRIANASVGTSVLPMPSLVGSNTVSLSSPTSKSMVADDNEDSNVCSSIPIRCADRKLQSGLLSPGLCTDDLMMDFEDEIESPTISGPSLKEWKVCDEYFPTLPMFHPLDRNAVFVCESSASDITERIRCAFHDRTIDVSYHPEIALAKCVSKANVEFRVQLYRGRKEYRHGFIVEVRRLDGFELSYQMDVFAILDAAEGIKEEIVVGVSTLEPTTFLKSRA